MTFVYEYAMLNTGSKTAKPPQVILGGQMDKMITIDFIVLMFGITGTTIIVMHDIKKAVRRESNRLFKAMVYLQNRLLSEPEMKEVYENECRKHGFDKV